MALLKLAALATGLVLLATVATARDIKVGGLLVSHPSCEQIEGQRNALAARIKIANTGSVDDRLIGASFASASQVLLDNHRIEDMHGVAIPAGAAVVLKSSVIPLTFAGLDRLPVEGTLVAGTLVFEKAGVVAVDFLIGG